MGNEGMSAGQLLKQANKLKRVGRLDEAIGCAQQLLDLGVPKSDIVLAFRSPYMRQFSEFSVN